MVSDISLDREGDGWVSVDSFVLKASSSDFMLDAAARRRSSNPAQFRRALVHDEDDGLTVNFAGDYAGGVTVASDVVVDGGITAEKVRLRRIQSPDGALPRQGKVGEVIMVENSTVNPVLLLPDISIWMCVGTQTPSSPGEPAGDVFWQQISLGGVVAGTTG